MGEGRKGRLIGPAFRTLVVGGDSGRRTAWLLRKSPCSDVSRFVHLARQRKAEQNAATKKLKPARHVPLNGHETVAARTKLPLSVARSNLERGDL